MLSGKLKFGARSPGNSLKVLPAIVTTFFANRSNVAWIDRGSSQKTVTASQCLSIALTKSTSTISGHLRRQCHDGVAAGPERLIRFGAYSEEGYGLLAMSGLPCLQPSCRLTLLSPASPPAGLFSTV